MSSIPVNHAADDEVVTLYAPDQSLRSKLGNADLDRIFTPQAIAAAQEQIVKATGTLLTETEAALRQLQQDFAQLQRQPAQAAQSLDAMIAAAFIIKSKIGFAGYDLVVELAKSLQLLCEQKHAAQLTERDLRLMHWHIGSIARLYEARITGDGGKLGQAIRAELAVLFPPGGQSET